MNFFHSSNFKGQKFKNIRKGKRRHPPKLIKNPAGHLFGTPAEVSVCNVEKSSVANPGAFQMLHLVKSAKMWRIFEITPRFGAF